MKLLKVENQPVPANKAAIYHRCLLVEVVYWLELECSADKGSAISYLLLP